MLLETPCIIIDQKRMDQNILAMANMAKQFNVKLRPHVKTHKIPSIALKQCEKGAIGITVAKVSEAEVMAERGIKNIFIAYPLVGLSKIKRALKLNRQIHLIVGVDSLEGAIFLSQVAQENKQVFRVRLEIDTGLKRTGVSYKNAISIARRIKELPGLSLEGIYTYRGALLDGKPTLDVKQAGIQEGKIMVDLARRMREEGIPIQEISVGSTPTARYVAQVDGITEIRPGTYVFYDQMQIQLGICQPEDCAASVLVTVVSRSDDGYIVIDGGSKTFATDVQPDTPPLNLRGFGRVINHPDAVLERMTEEHGMIRVPDPFSFFVGQTLQIIPNHICSTVNLHNHVYLKTGDENYQKLVVEARGKLE